MYSKQSSPLCMNRKMACITRSSPGNYLIFVGNQDIWKLPGGNKEFAPALYGDQHHPILLGDLFVAAFKRQNLLEI
jgi:hypothetical protein